MSRAAWIKNCGITETQSSDHNARRGARPSSDRRPTRSCGASTTPPKTRPRSNRIIRANSPALRAGGWSLNR